MKLSFKSEHASSAGAEQRRKSPTQPRFDATQSLHHALTELQLFGESVYYHPNDPHKAVTTEMRQLITEPIDAVIAHEQEKNDQKTASTSISLHTWQQGNAPHVAYSDLQAHITSPDTAYPPADHKAYLQQYIARSVTEALPYVTKDTGEAIEAKVIEAARYAASPPVGNLDGLSTEDTLLPAPDLNPQQEERAQEVAARITQTQYVLGQMKEYGVDTTRYYYECKRRLMEAQSPREIDLVETNILEVEAAPLKDELIAALRGKKELLLERADEVDDIRTAYKLDEAAADLQKEVDVSWEYLMSLIPDKDKGFFHELPRVVLSTAVELRRLFPFVANAEVLKLLWWHLRLGGPRANDIYNHLAQEYPKFVEEQKLKRYTEHLADNYLRSEAAGFEFEKTIQVSDSLTPNKVLFQTMKDLIKYHIPKNQRRLHFTLLDGESKLMKLSLPYHEGISDDEIYANINRALAAQWESIDLSDRQRAELSYIGYDAKKRKNHKTYNAIYGGFGDKKNAVDGDYLVQMNATHEDTRDPRSLFAVDSHKVAFRFYTGEVGKMKVTARYSHPYYDGQPAQVHMRDIMDHLTGLDDTMHAPTILSHHDAEALFLHNAENDDEVELPLCEARADYDDYRQYKSASFGENSFLSSTDQRGLMIALAQEDIETNTEIAYYQQLFKGSTDPSFYQRYKNADNVQPVVVAPKRLTRQGREAWARAYRAEVKRTQDDRGAVALFGGISGTREGPLSFAGSFMNKEFIKMLRNSQGMVSVLVGLDGSFTTAFSDAYRPSTIDLNHPEASMGIIGMLIPDAKKGETGPAHYSVRLLPAHAQVEFSKAANDLISSQFTHSDYGEVRADILRQFTTIISAWNDLVAGQGAGGSISLSQYEKIRDSIFNKLYADGYIDPSKDIHTGKELQKYLNTAFKKAASLVLNESKLSAGHARLSKLISS